MVSEELGVRSEESGNDTSSGALRHLLLKEKAYMVTVAWPEGKAYMVTAALVLRRRLIWFDKEKDGLCILYLRF